jgi:hypothetical protein
VGNTLGTAQGPAGTNTSVDNTSVVTAYKTASTFNAPLNGGGFNRMPDPYVWETTTTISYKASSSAHKMDVSGPLWGSGLAVDFGGTTGLTCTDCHDPHGSSNYRLLKAKPNPAGPTVGGYEADNVTPNPFVWGAEQGYPVPDNSAPGIGAPDTTGNYKKGGWLKHQAGADQMALYRPNYTDTTGTPILHVLQAPGDASDNQRTMSVWCAACHQKYNQTNAADAVSYSYNPYLPAPGLSGAAQVGTKDYHRHAVDKNMGAGLPGQALVEPVVQASNWVPLEVNYQNGSWDQDYLGCLTCHRAHGSSVEMTGYAAAHLETNASGTYAPVRDGIPGVDPDKGSYGGVNNQGSSALLRANNRGVCERCHNK